MFIFGILACFWQVFTLVSSVSWIEGFALDRPGHREAEQQLEVGRRALADRGLDESALVAAKAKLLSTPTPKVDAPRAKELHQEIRFCHSYDGTRIAYATVGEGPVWAGALSL